jgi:hypothetical protein
MEREKPLCENAVWRSVMVCNFPVVDAAGRRCDHAATEAVANEVYPLHLGRKPIEHGPHTFLANYAGTLLYLVG